MLKSSHLDEAAVIKSSINFSTVIKSTDITSNSSKEKDMTMTLEKKWKKSIENQEEPPVK